MSYLRSRALRLHLTSRFPRSYPQHNKSSALSTSSCKLYPRKDSQDRESINTEATEYSKSGTDDQSAHQEKAAFEPGKTRPEEEYHEAGKNENVNPLDVSPANQDISKPKQCNVENSANESQQAPEKSSGRGSTAKGTKAR